MIILRIIAVNCVYNLCCLCSFILQFIEVQPNDGFGTLLPQETLEIDLIFSANKAKEFNFQLSCKSGINRLTFNLFIVCKMNVMYGFFYFYNGCLGMIQFTSYNIYIYIYHNNLFFFVIRDFLLSCRAVGVRPPLELSHSLVQFGATAVGDHSTAVLHLTNHHQSKQAMPSPIAPRLFSFTLPEDSDISITPSAGRLLPGEVK